MGAVLKLAAFEGARMQDLPALLNSDPWSTATNAQRLQADQRAALIEPFASRLSAGASVAALAQLVAAQYAGGNMPVAWQYAVDEIGGLPSEPTLRRWLADFKRSGKAGLLPAHTGRVRKDYGWELRARQLYNLPSKPGFCDVTHKLLGEGFGDATESRVSRFLKSLPATQGKLSPARVGPHLHKLTRRTYQERSLDDLLVGEIYAGDGHTCDCYVAHPNTGMPMRLELTAFIDIKTGYLPGWWFSESESQVSTLFALSHAMRSFDHVPAWLYVDRGAGYRSQLLNDGSTGWYAKFDIGVIGAIAGNPHGKGWIERFFRTLRDRHDKFFAGGQVYCGDDMADETNRRMSAEVRSGKRKLPSAAEYIESFRNWLEQYHNTLLEQRGSTPRAAWAALQPVAIELPQEAVMRPRAEATARRQRITLHKRDYFHSALSLYDGQMLVVEYDLHDDKHAWIYDKAGRYICEAVLTSTIGVLPTSRLEEGREKRLAGQRKRLERKLQEVKARRDDAITTDAVVAGMEAVQAPFQATLNAPKKAIEGSPERRAQLRSLVEDAQDVDDISDLEDIDLLNPKLD